MADNSWDRPLTLAEVAAAAGVSVPTVSKVINQRSDVAPATRERVQRVLAERGYVVNRAGRSLRQGKSRQIDVISQDLDSYYAFQILRGIQDALLATDLRAVLASTHDHRRRELQWIQRLADGSTDGAILILADHTSLHLQELRRRAIPFVVVDPAGELGPDDLSVTATNWAGAKAATDHLLALGHRRIAALLGPPDFAATRARLGGYRAALLEAGLPFDARLVRHGDWQAERAAVETGELLALPDPPTAIFAGNDQQALGVYRALWRRDLRVPDDLSVVGFDDLPYAALVTPALTTVRQPLLEMGRVATTMLLRLMAGEPVDSVRVELATPLIARESCAASRRQV
ncbi:MAG: LacI family transcriptional regulator [Chloroflexi bacterium]|nr:LacI family transcriptional regulator [Chloroflexota bacterium]